MKSHITSIIIGIIIIFSVATIVYTTKKPVTIPVDMTVQTPDTTATTTTVISTSSVQKPVTSTASTTPKPTGITLAQVAEHNSRTSCWSVVHGNVYNLTSWIPNHPGGEQRILGMCGVDGSQDYDEEHGGKRKPTAILAGFKIGALAQ
jgi:cytochrome b involved in lipid metabolism